LLKGDATQVNEAVQLLNSKPGPANDAAIPFYHQLVSSVLSRPYQAEQMVDQAEVVSTLRELLFKLAKQYRGHAVDKQLPIDIEELLMATHYQSMFYLCLEHGLIDTAAKCAVTLLKYPEVITADKAFYQAGATVRDQGNTNLAFLLLNRFVPLPRALPPYLSLTSPSPVSQICRSD
jgi:intraflagellar transport protein 172